MKRFFSLGLIAIVLAAFAFTSCSKDDDDDSNGIVGKWELVSMKMEAGGMSLTFEGEDLDTDIMEFKSDGTCTSTSEEDGKTVVDKGKYSISGDVLTVTDEEGTKESIKFSISGNTLVLYQEGYYDTLNDKIYEKQPEGQDYPYAKMSMTYKRK